MIFVCATLNILACVQQCIPKDEWPEDLKEVADINADFVGDLGDRRQELVFIGVGMDRAKIVQLFDECLLTDSEMEAYVKHWATPASQ